MLRFDPSHIAAFYDAYGDRESERWLAGPRATMQYEIFCHHLRQRIRPGDRVLDAGCGPGTFAKVLVELGARVTCFDVSPVQLGKCRHNVPQAEAHDLGSITDLSRYETGSFDVALAFGGPLSYCFDRAADALSELMRATRPDGWVGVSVMNLFGSMHRFFPAVLELPTATNERIVRTGDLDRETNDGHECHMFRVDELRSLLEGAGLTDVELHASGWLVSSDQIDLPGVGTDEWNLLLDAELQASRESPGAGTHVIAWGRKVGSGSH